MAAIVATPFSKAAFVAHDELGHPQGFIEAALRHDYVNGTTTSPVAFLEGIYVATACRRHGVARQLVTAAEGWAISCGCIEFASDALLDNAQGHAMHAALGFQETERVVYFRKLLA
jgi:aminoglycoside 6'-N-acetyltransferase I